MKSALTKEEWEVGTGPFVTDGNWTFRRWDEVRPELFIGYGEAGRTPQSAVRRPHALAALALYKHPFGFDNLRDLGDPSDTFVRALRETADAMDKACGSKMVGSVRVVGPSGEGSLLMHRASMFRALADRIEALLPQEEGKP